MEKKLMTLLLPEDLHTKLKILAAQRKTSMTAIILELIEKELRSNESEKT